MSNLQQDLSNLAVRVGRIENMVIRIGKVTEVDEGQMLVRVSWDGAYRSAMLRVLRNGIICNGITCEGKYCGRRPWMPSVGQMVVSIHRPTGDGEGYVIGAL